jgi:hypothetical protein
MTSLRDRLRNGRQDEGPNNYRANTRRRCQRLLEPDEKIEWLVHDMTSGSGWSADGWGIWIVVTDRSVVRINCVPGTSRPSKLELRLSRTSRLLEGPINHQLRECTLHPHFGRPIPWVPRPAFNAVEAIDQKIAQRAAVNPD